MDNVHAKNIFSADRKIHDFFAKDACNPRYVFWREAVERLESHNHSRPTLYCLGDSHVELFHHLQVTAPLPHADMLDCQIRTASAAGLGKQDSLTQSHLFTQSYLPRIPVSAPLLLCFGEVDCNSRIPFRMDKYKTSAKKEIADSLKEYSRFMDQLSEQGRSRLIIYAVHPPCQRKDKPEKERRFWLDLPRRTRITLAFNNGLEKLCRERNSRFLSLERQLVDPATNLVRVHFLRRSKTNHHLDFEAVTPVLRNALVCEPLHNF